MKDNNIKQYLGPW